MKAPIGFASWTSYFHFVAATDFADARTGYSLQKEKNAFERIGEIVVKPIFLPLNFLVREIKNPLVIVALTTSLIAIATLIFYPTQFMAVCYTALPFLAKVKPWMVKFALYLVAEGTITALGMRALGRLCNRELVRAWHAREIIPIHLGAKRG
jgi:hypothetical protein